MSILILLTTYLLIAVLFIAQPWFARKNVMFGVVFADESIWEDKKSRQIRSRYLSRGIAAVCILLMLLIGTFTLIQIKTVQAAVYSGTLILLILIESLFFVSANRQMRALKQVMPPNPRLSSGKITVSIGNNQTAVVPLRWFLLLLPLLLATVMIAVFGYPAMADRIPIHFGLAGPDRWADKSWGVVLSPIALELVIGAAALLIRHAPAAVKGNPDAAPDYPHYRKAMVRLMIGFCLINELFFLLIVISFLTPVATFWFNIGMAVTVILVIAMLLLYFRLARGKQPSGRILNDDDKWVGGIFYFNRSDPSLFIEKRVGIGYTLNMARPTAWVLLIGGLVIIIASIWFGS